MIEMAWNKNKVRNPELRKQLDDVFTGESAVKIALDTETPVNAVAADLTLAAADIAILNNDDTVTFDGNTFTKVGSGESGNEFTNTAELAALIDDLEDWGAAVDGSDIDITAATKGIAYNNTEAVYSIVSDTTAGGGESADAVATIVAADLAQLAAGDTVEFDGNTFTTVASSAGDNEFTNTAGLTALLNALDDWEAVVDGSDIDITSAANGAEWNDIDVILTITKETANGVDGTVGTKGTIVWDSSKIYIATDDNTISDANWKYASLT
jgi:hypothetical protein